MFTPGGCRWASCCGCHSPAHSKAETQVVSGNWTLYLYFYVLYLETNISAFSFVEFFFKICIVLLFRHFQQTYNCFELTANIHRRSTSTTCILISRSLWQSLNLLKHRLHVTHFRLRVPFVPVVRCPMQQYMNICKYARLIMHLTCLWFKLSALMAHLQLNYTTFDVWLTVGIFGLCKRLLGEGSQTAGKTTLFCLWMLYLIFPWWLNRDNLTAENSWWIVLLDWLVLGLFVNIRFWNSFTIIKAHGLWLTIICRIEQIL